MDRIYCVEDDEAIRELTLYALRSSGYEAEGFEKGSDFFEAASKAEPNLVLLDIMLPEEDGLSILRRIRETSAMAGTPVIMLTAKTSEYDKVKGLDSGADDYVTKPFGVMELLSRVKAVLRRTQGPAQGEILTLGGLTVDIPRRVVTLGER